MVPSSKPYSALTFTPNPRSDPTNLRTCFVASEGPPPGPSAGISSVSVPVIIPTWFAAATD